MQRLSFLYGRALACALVFVLGATGAFAATLPSGFSEQSFTGITNPTALAFAPDGRVFVSQQCGQLRIIKNGAVLATPFATISVSCSDERGLHSIAFDPDFATNGYVYIRYTRNSPTNNVIGRLQASPPSSDTATSNSPTVLFTVPFRDNRYHHGGGLVVGNDGMLYSSFGDHQSGSGQGTSNLWGKVVRINRDGSIPGDNPFPTASGDMRAIWATGFRNPFTMAIQRGTGRIHVNDVGDGSGSCCEEINNITRGTNYGWPSIGGSSMYFGYTASSQGGNAITGGGFYNPETVMFPSSYVGRYFFADYGGGWIRSVMGSGTPGAITSFASGISGPTDVEAAPDGALWYTSRNSSAVRRITFGNPPPTATPTASPTPTPRFTPTPTPTSGPNGRPVPVINAPPDGTKFKGSDVISFAGECTDPEDGIVPAARVSWSVVFHHTDHTHGQTDYPGVKGGSFSIPTDIEWDPIQWWRITMACTDSGNQTVTAVRDVHPLLRRITLQSSPSGLQVAADSLAGAAPQSGDAIVGLRRILNAPSPQTSGGQEHLFASWSDGGAQRHDVLMPNADTTYAAAFRPASDYAEAVVPAGSITASTSDANVPANTVDNNLATRWSANGDNQWIRFDLGSPREIGHLRVAVYQGNARRNRFDIEVANGADGPWTQVFTGESTGTTTAEELYDFADVTARYVRYLGHGNVLGSNPFVNSVTEISIFTASSVAPPTPTPTSTPDVPPTPTPTPTPTSPVPAYEESGATATASTSDTNVAAGAVDNDLATRWSGNGDGATLTLDLGATKTVGYVGISFYQGDTRISRFDLQVGNSPSGPWTNVLTNVSSNGMTTQEETFDFADASGRYVRFVGHGNNNPTKATWNSVQEISVFVATGAPVPTATPTPTGAPTHTPTPTGVPTNTPTPTPTTPNPVYVEITPGATGVSASTNDGNVPANTVDNNLATRWSGNGDGATITFDLGATNTVGYITVATYNGNVRTTTFDIQVGAAASGPFTTVRAGAVTSGTTLNEETFDFGDVAARYVRIVGHGNSVNMFNSLTEVSIFGSACTSCPTPVPTATPTRTPAPNQVSILDFAFQPATITINVGQSVTWVNNDTAPHTSTSDTGVWDSGTLAAGQSFTRTFNTAGTFPYHCTFHPGMTGTVVVIGSPTPTPTPTMPPTGPFVITSSAFADNALMPVRFTCAGDGSAGQDTSPPLAWGAGTMNAAAYAIVFADRVNNGNKLHWMIWDIKPSQLSLPEGLGAGFMVPGQSPAKQKGFTTGANTLSFFGPCPGGSTNPYTFTLYAQNVATIPGVTSGSTVTQIEAAIKANSSTTTAVLRARSNASAN